MAKKKKSEKKEVGTGVAAALAAIHKKYGKGSIMKMGKNHKLSEGIETISTSSVSLDAALGIGGLAKGRVTEIYGPEASGKTTLALQAVAEAQHNGGAAAFVDVEHAFDPIYAGSIGVDIDELLVSQPDSGEEALEIVEALVRSGDIDIIVVDSVSALVTQKEIDGDMGDAHMGTQARLMSQALRKLTSLVSKMKTCLIFINQIRMKIGVMFGNPETTSGGNALKFYASVRIDIRRIGPVGDKNNSKGNQVRAKVAKNKLAPPFRVAEFKILFGTGVDKVDDLITCGVACGVIDKKGTWYYYKDTKLGQGVDGCRKALGKEKNYNIIRKKVMQAWV